MIPPFRHALTCLSLATLFIARAGLGAEPVAAALPTTFAGASPLQWSVRMADSETARLGDRLAWRTGRTVKWDYTAGLFTWSLLQLNAAVPMPAYVAFSRDAIGSFISEDGQIQGYQLDDYNIDNIAPGRTVLALYALTQEARYKKCADLLRQQLASHPRTSEGGFWHKKRYPSQMWLDGLYMGAPFYAEYTADFAGPATNYDDVIQQFRLIGEHLYDPQSGLFYHGWDEKKVQDWANHATGTSSNFWGRGLGWLAMAEVDVLDFLPSDYPVRTELVALLQKTAAGVVKWQDPATGLWWQVLDRGGQAGNYREATASAMFVYSLAKAVNRGYLSRDYLPAILKGYEGLITQLIKTDARGRISLSQCCSVAGLGYGRDGSYEYYLREPVVDNDRKGVGPFILAGLEIQRLLGLPMQAQHELKPMEPTGPASAKEWEQVPAILARIVPPVFPGRVFSITDYGAVAGGQADCSAAIARAMAAAVASGGGTVNIPAGEFLTGPIHLQSRINLHLDHGATLKFSTNFAAYLPAVRTRFEGMECYNYSPLIYACGQTNIAVTGDGTLDGQADDSTWLAWKGRKGVTNGTQRIARARLDKMNNEGVPVSERVFGEGDFLRPNFIQFNLCRNVLIEGVKIRRSPMWEIHPLLCTNVTVRGVDIVTHGANNDGCDPESCSDVLIEGCLFDTGDDCIAIKSGRNADGRRVGVPSQNIIIRDCVMRDGHGGTTIGSEISGGCSNVFVENCEMSSPELTCALRLKSNAMRGGTLQNIFMRNVTVGQVSDSVLQIDFLYEEGTKGEQRPVARNVVMENITGANIPRVLNVRGFPAATISDVRIYHSTFKQVKKPDQIIAADVKLVDCKLEPAEKSSQP